MARFPQPADGPVTAARPRFLLMTSGYPPAGTAGLERGCERLAHALARRGFAVIVLTVASPGLPREETTAGVRVLRVMRPLRLGPLWGLTYALESARWLWRLRQDWDLVLGQQLYLHSAVAAPLARRLRKRSANLLVAADSHSDILRLARLRGGRFWLRLALSADGAFALSRRSAAELRAAGVPASRIFPYRYFIDLDAFAPGDPGAGSEFLFMGRFDRQKNLPLLVEAFERVRESAPEARLRLVGRGPEEDAIRRRIAAGSASRAIAVEPWTDNPATRYRAALAVVTSSDAEGLSNVLIEAMACGAPVITTDVSGAREALGDDGHWPEPLPDGTFQAGEGGWLVNRGDASALARTMLDLLAHPEERALMGARARLRACDHYSEAVCVAEFLAHMESILARGPNLDTR